MDLWDLKESKVFKELEDLKVLKEIKEIQENEGLKDLQENEVQLGLKEIKDQWDQQAQSVLLVHKETKEIKGIHVF